MSDTKPRHWWIEKPTSHNCPNRAVFEEYQPTIVNQGCEWIKVFSADDIHKKIGMGLTRYLEVCAERDELREKLEIARKVIECAFNYMKNYDCDKYCDQYVNAHQPECCIARDFYEALEKIDAKENKNE